MVGKLELVPELVPGQDEHKLVPEPVVHSTMLELDEHMLVPVLDGHIRVLDVGHHTMAREQNRQASAFYEPYELYAV